ncbi:MAG TPA: FAD:protein FMN transferase [Nitrospirota bacterium]|nr:FAD:protein FMN transferase [Nitrospirota bacterium]
MKQTILLAMLLALAVAGCSRVRTVQKTEPIMGTDVTITVVAKSRAGGGAAIDAAMDEVRRFDRMMSLYKIDSEVSKVNEAAGRHPVVVSPEMIDAVESARRVSELSGGVFDITIGPLVVLWQMRLKEGTVPTDSEIARVKPLVNYRNIVVDRKASTIFLKRPGMIMDLGGMKGYIADRVRDLLRAHGIDNAVIALAGDIWVMGRREDGTPWRIGVQHPRERDKTLIVLGLSDKYITTSGDYERFVIRGNKRYHHIIDPRTGKPSTGVISATLIGDQGSLIDPLAKAPFILGPEEGMKIVKQAGAEAIIVDEGGRTFMTDGIKTMEAGARK